MVCEALTDFQDSLLKHFVVFKHEYEDCFPWIVFIDSGIELIGTDFLEESGNFTPRYTV